MHTFTDLSKGAKILLAIASVVVLAEGAYLYYVQTHRPVAANTCTYVVAEWEKASPEVASAKEVYTGPIAEINFESSEFPEAGNFTNAITEAVSEGVNFAGHFVIAEWGCGTNCQDHAIVDVMTGNIVAFGIPSEAGLSFDTGSSLIMTNPAPNLPSPSDLSALPFADQLYWFNIPREYYVLAEENGSVTLSRLCIENAFDGRLF